MAAASGPSRRRHALALLAAALLGGVTALAATAWTDVAPLWALLRHGRTARDGIALLPPGEAPARVPAARQGSLLLTHVRLNGADAGPFVVDTGAEANIVATGLPARLGLEPVLGGEAATPLSGVSGHGLARLWKIDRLAIGPVTLRRHFAAEVDLGWTQGTFGAGVAGVLGRDTLKQLPVTLDFTGEAVTFHDPAAFEPLTGSTRVALEDCGPALLVPAIVNGRSLRLQLDTGCEGTLVLRPEHGDLFGRHRLEGRLQGIPGGGVAASGGWLREVEVLGRTFRRVPALRLPEEGHLPDCADGLLGAQLLTELRLTLDLPRATLWVDGPGG